MVEQELKNVPGLEPDQVVVIRKFGYGSMRKIRNTISVDIVTDPKTGRAIEKPAVNFGDLQLAFFVHGVKSAPFFKTGMTDEEKRRIVDSDDFDTRIVDYCYPKIAELNNVQQLEELKKK